jgi:hypothetical protein
VTRYSKGYKLEDVEVGDINKLLENYSEELSGRFRRGSRTNVQRALTNNDNLFKLMILLMDIYKGKQKQNPDNSYDLMTCLRCTERKEGTKLKTSFLVKFELKIVKCS